MEVFLSQGCTATARMHACSQIVGVSVPAPRPFSPFSSSSSRRKLRGTFALMVVLCCVVIGELLLVLVRACDYWERLQVGIGKI